MEWVGIRSLIWYPGVLAAALAGGLLSSVSTILLFVLVREVLFYFLSLCFTALIAALCAVLVGNALAGDGRRVRLWAVVVAAEAAGVLAALANLVFVDTLSGGNGALSRIGLGQQMDSSMIVVSLISGVAAARLRRSPVDAGAGALRDTRSAVLLIVLASLLLVAGVVIDGMSSPAA